MANLPKRSDSIYKEIENFKDYELTQCVAYEMSIRNYVNLNTLYTLLEEYSLNKDKLITFLNRKRTTNNIIRTNDMFLLSCADAFNSLRFQVLALEFIPNNEFLHDTNISYIKSKIFSSSFIELLNLLMSENYPKERTVKTIDKGLKKTLCLENNLTYFAINEKKVRDGYSVITTIKTTDEEFYNDVNSIEDYEIHCLTNSVGEDFSNDKNITEIRIQDNFSRPLIEINGLLSLQPILSLNINRPLPELIDYIKHIKNDLGESQDIIKAPIELIGEKLQKADNLICDDKGKCFDSRTILSKQQRLADMFFLYDFLENLNILFDAKIPAKYQRQIQNEIFNYYADKGLETKVLDIKTIRKYKNLAIEYIDNMKYKELITGVSIKDI